MIYTNIVLGVFAIFLIFYGIRGIKNKKIIPLDALSASGKEELARGKNLPYFEARSPNDLTVKGGWAIEAGIFSIILGIVILVYIISPYFF